ncbi:hypothetical protein GCM10028778_27210 [Barrientosiimonas marina]
MAGKIAIQKPPTRRERLLYVRNPMSDPISKILSRRFDKIKYFDIINLEVKINERRGV